jgi:hypothetical protein
MERLHTFLLQHDALSQRADGIRSGRQDQIIRLQGRTARLPEGFGREARKIGLSMVTTTVHDNYWMFIKLNRGRPPGPLPRCALHAHATRGTSPIRFFAKRCSEAVCISRANPAWTAPLCRIVSS